MPKDTDPMRVLQAAIAILGMHDPDATDNSPAANLRKAVRLTEPVRDGHLRPPSRPQGRAPGAARRPTSATPPTSSTC